MMWLSIVIVERDWIALLLCYKAGFPLDEIFREERTFFLSGDLSGGINDHDTYMQRRT